MPVSQKQATRQIAVVNKWSPGLVTIRPPALLNPGEATVASNVLLDEGGVKRRQGYTLLSAGGPGGQTSPISGLYPFYTGSGAAYLLGVSSRSLAYSTGGGWTTISSSLDAGSLTPPLYCTFAGLNGGAYIGVSDSAGLTQVLRKWDGSTYSVSTSPPGALVTDWNSGLWVAGSTATPSRLFWSGLTGISGPDTWPATNFIDLAPGDGDVITGLGRTLNNLVVLKQRSIFMLQGQQPDNATTSAGTLQVTQFRDQLGCVAPRTVASSRNLTIYMGRRGVYAFDGVTVHELTQNVRPLFDALDQTKLTTAVGGWINWSPHRYMLRAVNANGSYLTLVLTLDSIWTTEPYTGDYLTGYEATLVSSWTTQDPIDAMALMTFVNAKQAGVFGFHNGTVGQYGGTTDNGNTIPWQYTTGPLPLGPQSELKFTRFCYFKGAGGGDSCTVGLIPNYDTTLETSQTAAFTQVHSEPVVTYRTVLPVVSRVAQLDIKGSGTSGPQTQIDEVTIVYTPRVVP